MRFLWGGRLYPEKPKYVHAPKYTHGVSGIMSSGDMTWENKFSSDVRLPSRKQSAKILWVGCLLNQVIHLTTDAQLNAIFRTLEFLLQSQKNTLGDLVDIVLTITCKCKSRVRYRNGE